VVCTALGGRMSRLTITNSAQDDGAMASYGTLVTLDGREVRECRSVDLSVRLDEIVKAKVEVLVTQALDVEIDADVTVNLIAPSGDFEIEETPLPSGGRRLRAICREVSA
jgi:hypothetical protein